MESTQETTTTQDNELNMVYLNNTPRSAFDLVLELLNGASKPLSVDLIAEKTGLNHSQTCKALRQLEKYGHIEIKTRCIARYWGVKHE